MSTLADAVENAAGRILGDAELLVGSRLYPITVYESCVEEGVLWRGSVRDAVGYRQLAAQGMRAVVNLCAEHDEAADVEAAGMLAFKIPIIDNTQPNEAQVSAFLSFVDTCKAQGLPVYVHCEAGKGRTGYEVAGWRICRQGWAPERALAEAEAFGLSLPAQRDWILNLK